MSRALQVRFLSLLSGASGVYVLIVLNVGKWIVIMMQKFFPFLIFR